MHLERAQGVLPSAQHQGWDADRLEIVSPVFARHDRMLLAKKCRLPHTFGHRHNDLCDGGVVQTIRMDQMGQQPRRNALKFPDLGQLNKRGAIAALLVIIGPGIGGGQDEPFDSFRRLPHDFLGNVAAQREAREGEGRGGGRQEPLGHRRDGIVLGQVRHRDRKGIREVLDLVFPQGFVAKKAWDQNEMPGAGHDRFMSFPKRL